MGIVVSSIKPQCIKHVYRVIHACPRHERNVRGQVVGELGHARDCGQALFVADISLVRKPLADYAYLPGDHTYELRYEGAVLGDIHQLDATTPLATEPVMFRHIVP